MYNMFFSSGYFYGITIVLQVICVIHCIRRGNQNYWIWLIIFLPLIGCIAYIFTEMFTRRGIQEVQSGVGDVFNPGGRIKKLENNLRFSDTFNNRVALADAYLANGHTDRAISLYESSLTGNFTENEYVLSQLVAAYFQKKEYGKLIPIAKKIRKLPQFARSRSHIYYAIALDHTGQPEEAEAEFKLMKGKFSNFEARYQYACFLARHNHKEEAHQLFTELLNEAPHLTGPERRNNGKWFSLAKEELKKF